MHGVLVDTGVRGKFCWNFAIILDILVFISIMKKCFYLNIFFSKFFGRQLFRSFVVKEIERNEFHSHVLKSYIENPANIFKPRSHAIRNHHLANTLKTTIRSTEQTSNFDHIYQQSHQKNIGDFIFMSPLLWANSLHQSMTRSMM